MPSGTSLTPVLQASTAITWSIIVIQFLFHKQKKLTFSLSRFILNDLILEDNRVIEVRMAVQNDTKSCYLIVRITVE